MSKQASPRKVGDKEALAVGDADSRLGAEAEPGRRA